MHTGDYAYGTYSAGGKKYTVKMGRRIYHHYKNNPWFGNDNSSKKEMDLVVINLEIINCQLTLENYTGRLSSDLKKWHGYGWSDSMDYSEIVVISTTDSAVTVGLDLSDTLLNPSEEAACLLTKSGLTVRTDSASYVSWVPSEFPDIVEVTV